MPAYKDNKGKSWCVKFRYKERNGTVRSITKRGFATKREALQWEAEFREKQSGDLSMSFASFVDVYKEDRKPRLKSSTYDTKESIIESRILPYFGTMKLNEIDTTEVMRWQNELLKYRDPDTNEGFKPSYLKSIHNQLSAIMNHAVRFYGLRTNPARIVGNMGTESGIEMSYWTKDQYLRFAEEVMDSPMAYCVFQVLYWCGLRRGEALALTREDFDLDKGMLNINKTYHRKHGRDIITSPKTPKSVRRISMPDFLCQEMEVYFKMNYQLSPQDRVFPFTASFITKNLDRGAEKAGLPRIRVHDLRHSHVSLLIDMGFGAVAIAQRMGHESIDITYRYAHLFPSVQTEIADRLHDALEEHGND